MLHKIVAIFAFGIALSLASISTDAMAAGGAGAVGGHAGGLGSGAGVRGGVGVHGGSSGPGFMGRGFGSRGFDRAFARDRFFTRDRFFARDRFFRPGGGRGGWWGPPGFVDDDMCFAWTPSGYRWACGY